MARAITRKTDEQLVVLLVLLKLSARLSSIGNKRESREKK